MRYLGHLNRQLLSVARCTDPVVAVVAMGSVISSEGHFVAASGVHGSISKRQFVDF
jgi:hypothetical protein